jgi:hypothetical protein
MTFQYHQALALADLIRRQPPARSYIVRPTLLPIVVFRVALDSKLCLAANVTARRAFASNSWMHADVKGKLWDAINQQLAPWLTYRHLWPFKPHAGVRPQVIATKFSARAPDVGSNPAKAAIDMLSEPRWIDRSKLKRSKHRIGIIRDDRPEEVEQLHCWEYQPQRFPAFLIVEIRV